MSENIERKTSAARCVFAQRRSPHSSTIGPKAQSPAICSLRPQGPSGRGLGERIDPPALFVRPRPHRPWGSCWTPAGRRHMTAHAPHHPPQTTEKTDSKPAGSAQTAHLGDNKKRPSKHRRRENSLHSEDFEVWCEFSDEQGQEATSSGVRSKRAALGTLGTFELLYGFRTNSHTVRPSRLTCWSCRPVPPKFSTGPKGNR